MDKDLEKLLRKHGIFHNGLDVCVPIEEWGKGPKRNPLKDLYKGVDVKPDENLLKRSSLYAVA